MSKKKYDSRTISIFPEGFSMELPDGYRIDTEYDDDFNENYHLRGGFYINDDGNEDFAFTGSFLTLNVDLKVNENADPQAARNLRNPAHPDFAFNQVMEGVKGNLEAQHGEGKYIKLFNSLPVSAIMKFYQPFTIFGVTMDTYLVLYWVEVNENTVFGFTSVYRNNQDDAGDFHKHLLNVIKSVRVNGTPVDTGKLTPKKLEKALNLDANEDAESLDLGLSIGINFKSGDEETNYTLNSDGSISEEKVNTSLEYATPKEELYPHYNSMLRSQGLGMLGMLGVNVVVNQTGTEYKFYNLEDDLDEDASDEMRDAVSQLNDIGASKYKLADRAKEMMPVFHVSPEVFDTAHDRECELQEGMMHRAYMMSALRSFAWTMAKYCDALSKKPADLSLEQIQNIIDTIADANWLNYDNKSVCRGLCGTQDLHVYYLPDKTPESVKAVFEPSQEVIEQTKQMQEKFPNYNPILSQIGSLDKLRKDLEYIHPAIEKIYEDLKASRNYNEALLGNDADILYAWCALSYAARGPFFSEDGPTSCWFTQTVSEEEKRIASENERKELCEKWLADNGQYIEKDPIIEFCGKKFVFTGLGYRYHSMNDETDYNKLVEDRGGLTRRSVSGVTDYLVVEPAGAGEAKIQAMLENQQNGKPAKIILIDDLRKALGLHDFETEMAAVASDKSTQDTLPPEESSQITEETVIVDDSWAILVPNGFKYSIDKNIIGNHRNIIIMEDKPDNDFEDPFGASISFTSMFNASETDGMDGVAMAKMMVGFMGVKNNEVVRDDQDLYVSYYYEPDRSYKEAGEKLDVHHIKVGTVKGVSSIQVFFSNSPLLRRDQTKLVERVAKSIRLSKPGEKNLKHIVKLQGSDTTSSHVSRNPSAMQNLSGSSTWNFASADVDSKKKKLINNEKGYAVRFIPHSLALNSWRTDRANFQYYCSKHYPEYGAKVRALLDKAEQYSSVFSSDGTDKDLKKGMLKTTAPIHALKSFIWTANEIQGPKKGTAFPTDAPLDMWISLAVFIESKGYANYKPYKIGDGLFGAEILLNKEVRYYYIDGLEYISGGFYTDRALGKSMRNADCYSLFGLVDILTAVMPVMDLYYDQLNENEPGSAALSDTDCLKKIIEGWVAFAYACKQPFYVGAGNKYDIKGEAENDLSWLEKPEVCEYCDGAFTAYGTEIISINKPISGDALSIPEGITGIVLNDETKENLQRGLSNYKKIVYPHSYKGRLIATNQTEVIEVLGNLTFLSVKNVSEHQGHPKLRKLELKGTITDLVAGCVSGFPELRVLTLPEGLVMVHDFSLTEGLDEVYLPESLEMVDDDAFLSLGSSRRITLYVYRTCPALSRIQSMLDKRKRDQDEISKRWNFDLEPLNIKLKILESPWVTRADTFTYKIKNLYSYRKEANITTNEIKSLINDTIGNVNQFKKATGPLEEKAKSRGLDFLAEAVSNNADLEEAYEMLPGLLAKDINEQIQVRIQKENEKKLGEIKALSQSNSISDLTRAISMLEEFKGESANAVTLIDYCTAKLERIKEERYAVAVSLAEECTVDSINSALLKMKAISPYKDSDSKIVEWTSLLDKERKYESALASIDSKDMEELKGIKKRFEELGDYKDAMRKALECDEIIASTESLIAKKSDMACELIESGDPKSLLKAEAIYSELKSLDKNADHQYTYEHTLATIKDLRNIRIEIGKLNEELGLLRGFFKRKERLAVEEKIKSAEQKMNALMKLLNIKTLE